MTRYTAIGAPKLRATAPRTRRARPDRHAGACEQREHRERCAGHDPVEGRLRQHPAARGSPRSRRRGWTVRPRRNARASANSRNAASVATSTSLFTLLPMKPKYGSSPTASAAVVQAAGDRGSSSRTNRNTPSTVSADSRHDSSRIAVSSPMIVEPVASAARYGTGGQHVVQRRIGCVGRGPAAVVLGRAVVEQRVGAALVGARPRRLGERIADDAARSSSRAAPRSPASTAAGDRCRPAPGRARSRRAAGRRRGGSARPAPGTAAYERPCQQARKRRRARTPRRGAAPGGPRRASRTSVTRPAPLSVSATPAVPPTIASARANQRSPSRAAPSVPA